MSLVSDTELLAFAARTLERHGAAVEMRSERLAALLTRELADRLELPEEAVLGDEDAPLLYGSPLLDSLVELATREVPVTYGQIEVPYLKKAGFEQLIGRDLVFTDGRVRFGNRAEARGTYLCAVFHYVAMSDERKEGLVQVGVNEGSGAFIPGFVEEWSEARPVFFEPGKVPPHFPVRLESALATAMKQAQTMAREELADFLKSMERRLRRDVKSTREYYDALRGEMEQNLAQTGLTEQQQAERRAKIDELPAEMERKIVDLEQKYQVAVSLTARAAIRLLVDVVHLSVELQYRKQQRSLRLIWNPVTRGLDPLVCEGCGQTITRVQPVSDQTSFKLLCHGCARRLK